MRKKVFIWLIAIVQEASKAVLRCVVRVTDGFKVGVRVTSGVRVPFLFLMLMGSLTDEVSQGATWTTKTRKQVDENLEMWRFALEQSAIKFRSFCVCVCLHYLGGPGLCAHMKLCIV